MPIYSCEKCEKTFKQKSHYDTHINKKFACDENLPNEKKIELLKVRLKRTQDNCDEINKKYKNICADYDKIKIEHEQMTKELENIKKNNADIANNAEKIIIINKFGNDTIDETIFDAKTNRKILNKGYNSVEEYLKLLNFNSKLPENHNVYISSMKDKSFARVYDGKYWGAIKRSVAIEKSISKSIDFIRNVYEKLDNNNPLDKHAGNKIIIMLDNYDEGDKHTIESLYKSTELALYSGKSLVEDTIAKCKENAKTKYTN